MSDRDYGDEQPERTLDEAWASYQAGGTLTEDEVHSILLDMGPPWIEGTCYPVRRYQLMYGMSPGVRAAILAWPNPFKKAS